MSWLIHSSALGRAVAARMNTLQRPPRGQARSLAGPRALRRARDGVLRVITVVAGH